VVINHGVQREIVEQDRDKDLMLARGELGVHGPAQRGKQISLLSLVVNRLPRNCPSLPMMATSASAAAW
jgi:hypothetical protein